MLRFFTHALLITATLSGEERIRITESEAYRIAVARARPVYPPIAKQMRIAGKVQVELLIAPNGTVENVAILNGNALLTPAAVTAAKKWRFPPQGSGDKAARTVCTLTYNFQL
ncbi:MAG TPA: energy transducer TonB [Bryobacteraceae bacterium]|nr:energy transducer TonB [Bryobacteraceae bacterium]